MWGLENKTILVTGASGGIGAATVRQLVAAGADVIGAGRAEAALARLADETKCRTLQSTSPPRRMSAGPSRGLISGAW